jgi:integrase
MSTGKHTTCFPNSAPLQVMLPEGPMEFTKQTLAALALPEGKTDAIFFDDGLPGFGVRLRKGGKAVYIIQYRVGRQQRRESLGDVRRIELEAARKIARKKFAEVTLGGDPLADKAEAKLRDKLTLRALAERYLAAKKPILRPSSYGADERYLMQHWKSLHGRPLHLINRRDIALRLGELVAQHGVTAASRARGALSAFFVWSIREGITDQNPVSGTNDPGAGLRSRERVLSGDELRIIWRACEDDDFGRIVRLLMYTGARRDEIGGLRWDEIDLDACTLNVPGTRTKNYHPLSLLLPPAAIELLRSAPRREGREHVFGGRGEGFSGWSYSTLALGSRIIKARGKALEPWRIHDIRRSVATHMAELGVMPHIVETILNHRSGHRRGVAGTYNRATYEREVTSALLMWADHLQSIIDGSDRKVLPMRREVPG